MKILLTILLLLLLQPGFPQKSTDGFPQIDRKAGHVKSDNLYQLAKQLSALGKSETEKVRAIFIWITSNINYNTSLYQKTRKPAIPVLYYEEPEDSSSVLSSLNERVAYKVMKRKTAVCDGYSRLFKTLCDYAGIKSEIIAGYARTGMNNGRLRFGVNHKWNAVYLDSNWYLLDVTWASGFFTYSYEYKKQFDEFYFLTPPRQFAHDHYPEDPAWTLLKDPPVYREFYDSPFYHSAFRRSGITGYFPANGIIEASEGDSVRIELITKYENQHFYISTQPLFDSLSAERLMADTIRKDRVSSFYTMNNSDAEWLYVFNYDEVVMRYKLIVRKKKEALPGKLAIAENLK